MDSILQRPPVIGVVGPTGSGKSSVAVALAHRLDGEVISADSVQVYRGFDIGTGKISVEESAGIPHHLIDITEPDKHYDAAMFQHDADNIALEIASRNRVVILAGGTGLYLRAFLNGIFDLPSDLSVRRELQEQLEISGLHALYELLRQIDPDAAAWISPNDRIRIMRALEVYRISGQTFTQLSQQHGHREQRYPSLLIGISPERPKLYETIERRIDQMLCDGWSTEVLALRKRGFSPALKPMQAIGYRELNQMYDGQLCPSELRLRIGKNTRAYAKRQMTWFRKEKVIWYPSPQALLQCADLDHTIHRFLNQFNVI